MYDRLYVLRNSLFGKKKMTKRDFFMLHFGAYLSLSFALFQI